MIAPNSPARKGGKKRGEVKGEGVFKNLRGGGGEFGLRGNGATQSAVAPFVKGVEWGLGTRGLRMVAAFGAGIPVCDALPSRHPFSGII